MQRNQRQLDQFCRGLVAARIGMRQMTYFAAEITLAPNGTREEAHILHSAADHGTALSLAFSAAAQYVTKSFQFFDPDPKHLAKTSCKRVSLRLDLGRGKYSQLIRVIVHDGWTLIDDCRAAFGVIDDRDISNCWGNWKRILDVDGKDLLNISSPEL